MQFVIAICSVGSLKASLSVGSVVICDDYYCPWDLRRVHSDARAHVMPVLSEAVRTFIIGTVRDAGVYPLTHGVYANAQGPRFETKAEIRALAVVGDVVGMTAAHEASACIELGLPCKLCAAEARPRLRCAHPPSAPADGMLSVVDNYANGVGAPFTVDEFHAQQAENLGTVKTCVSAILAGVVARGGRGEAAGPASAALAELIKVSPEAVAAAAGPGAPPPASAATASVPASPCGPTEVDLVVHARWVVPVSPGHEQLVLNHHSIVVDAGRSACGGRLPLLY